MAYHARTRKLARQFPNIIEELKGAGYEGAAEFLKNRLTG
jgi:hypothetical protein